MNNFTKPLVSTMSTLDPLAVQITPVVFDFLFIEIKDSSLSNHTVQYIVTDAKNATIRKGSFKGLVMQLRMDFLQDGYYTINIHFENFDPVPYRFEKKTPKDADELVMKAH